jgi:hypothetical protein
MSVQQLTLPVLVQDGLPSGFERLPSAMRPPVAAVVAARAKRHCRAQCYKTLTVGLYKCSQEASLSLTRRNDTQLNNK